jgi:hypothetical protein
VLRTVSLGVALIWVLSTFAASMPMFAFVVGVLPLTGQATAPPTARRVMVMRVAVLKFRISSPPRGLRPLKSRFPGLS